MERLIILTMVSTILVGTAGCRQCNWFGRSPEAAVMPVYGSPAIPGATYVAPGTAPAAPPASCGPGCTSCGNTLTTLSGGQGYAPTPGT